MLAPAPALTPDLSSHCLGIGVVTTRSTLWWCPFLRMWRIGVQIQRPKNNEALAIQRSFLGLGPLLSLLWNWLQDRLEVDWCRDFRGKSQDWLESSSQFDSSLAGHSCSTRSPGRVIFAECSQANQVRVLFDTFARIRGLRDGARATFVCSSCRLAW